MEIALREPLQEIANRYGLYLDYKRPRLARGKRKKVTWEDSYGNTHDLDYVFEEGGSDRNIGRPRAFIEIAWRRYTKHSRNKAQEIQGAILPLAETYRDHSPFLGVILAGEFTEGSLEQLQSHDFKLVHFPYEDIVKAFKNVDVDVSFRDDAEEHDLRRKLDRLVRLNEENKQRVMREIRSVFSDQLNAFFADMESCLDRQIVHISVLCLSGDSHGFSSVKEAIVFISDYEELNSVSGFVRYELNVRYSNGDEIRCCSREKKVVIDFLQLLV